MSHRVSEAGQKQTRFHFCFPNVQLRACRVGTQVNACVTNEGGQISWFLKQGGLAGLGQDPDCLPSFPPNREHAV